MTANPYTKWLIDHAEALLALTPDALRQRERKDIFEHWSPENEWVHTEFANLLLIGAHLYTRPESPWHRSPRVLEFCRQHVEALLRCAL